VAIYRQVHISFWQDEFVLNLTPEEKFFYLYLMTNSKTSQCGIYELSKKVMCFETGYNMETIEKLLGRFIHYGKILYDESNKELMLVNWIKYNGSASEKVHKRIADELKEVKTEKFLTLFHDLWIDYGYSIDRLSIVYGYNNNKNKNNNQNNNQNQNQNNNAADEENVIDLIIEFWRQPQYSLQRLPANLSSTYSAIKKALPLYGKEKILSAIQNYSTILHSKEYLLNQNWTLARFLEHDSFERFLDIDEAKKYYARGNRKDYDESLDAIKNFSVEEV
jgi:hypothetical protein